MKDHTMKHAYIENGTAKEVARVDPFSIFHSSYASLFVECPDDVEAGWTFDGDQWAAPAPYVPVRTRADVLADLASIDMKSIRALREGNATCIAELETQAQALRTELAAL